jgi:hypothetical protein
MSKQSKGQRTLEALSHSPVKVTSEILEILMRDFLACAISGSGRYQSLETTGFTDVATHLALCASADDLDDVDWSVLTHPGSIIWPVLVSAYWARPAELAHILTSAAHGYRSAKTMAYLFGAEHRSKWHLTSTSGVFGAVSALSVYLKLSPEQHLIALKMAASNMAGSPQAGFERNGATQFNRAAAVSLACTAVFSAKKGASHIDDIWNPQRGLVSMYHLSQEINSDASIEILPGLDSISLRLFSGTGFMHSAMLAMSKCKEQAVELPFKVEIGLPESIKGLMDGSRGGDWWNPQTISASLLHTNNFFDLVHIDSQIPIEVTFETIPIGSGRATNYSNHGTVSNYVGIAPGLLANFSKEENCWKSQKWQKLTKYEGFEELAIPDLLKQFRSRLFAGLQNS